MTTISLLINTAADDDQDANGICFGGKPGAPEGALEWPTCASCDGHMQFLGQISVETQQGKTSLLLLFMCQNDPGLCDEWDADAGGNAVIVVPAKSIELVAPPEEGETIRPVRYGAAVVEIEGGSYDEAREKLGCFGRGERSQCSWPDRWGAGLASRRRSTILRFVQGTHVVRCSVGGRSR